MSGKKEQLQGSTPSQGVASCEDVEMDVGLWESVQEYITQLSAHCVNLRGSANELEEEARQLQQALEQFGRRHRVQRVLFENDDNEE
ncbi:hypothetical protein Ae201684P_011858 [Aphanomyces euteiches]|nr:hypothetical protein Ae201684P_011858 [Aphanomyces euteiches]KAH9156549.1 hypothetical protein AeRB84_001537 [Aphanomyces euteiches]